MHIKKIYLSLIISFFISSTSFALPGNRFFPSQDAKDHCKFIAWTDNSSAPIAIFKHFDNINYLKYLHNRYYILKYYFKYHS